MFVGNHPHGVIEVMVAADRDHGGEEGSAGVGEFLVAVKSGLWALYGKPIDFRAGRNAERLQFEVVIKQLRDHIKSGGAGFVAPSGAVATRSKLSKTATDGEWQPSAAKWARLHNATVRAALYGWR